MPASRGVAAGPAVRLRRVTALPDPQPVADPEAETARAATALAALAGELASRAAAATTGTARDILEAQVLMATDPTLADAVAGLVRTGRDAAHAVHAALTEQADGLRAGGGYLAERAADLEDLRDRAVARILGRPGPGVPETGHPIILIADDLAPADTATLDPEAVLALLTARGGPTSHTAIIARALGLPAVVGCPGVLEIEDGTLVSVDGESGEVRTGLDPAQAAAIAVRRQETQRAELRLDSGGGGRTADGVPIALLLNIGSAADLPAGAADAPGIEGVGLFRTELLFLDRHDAPGFEEQRAAYEAVFRALPGKRVVVRTLDAGADKPLPFLRLAGEPNPALGIRGLRVTRQRPELLDEQLAAIAAAAGSCTADVWVMAPMVSTEAEAAEFADRARRHGLPRAGVMVEVPAAALRAERILRHVDFLSIGTNDLGQYTMAADRQNGALADLLDPWQPALLDLIAACADAAAAAGKPVGVCGEAAADPLLAPVLVGLGMTSLSMAPRAVPAVRQALAERTRADARRLAGLARSAGSEAQARRLVRESATACRTAA